METLNGPQPEIFPLVRMTKVLHNKLITLVVPHGVARANFFLLVFPADVVLLGGLFFFLAGEEYEFNIESC